jgi:hypothetical protein
MKAAAISCIVRALAEKAVQESGEIFGCVTNRQPYSVWDDPKYMSKGV